MKISKVIQTSTAFTLILLLTLGVFISPDGKTPSTFITRTGHAASGVIRPNGDSTPLQWTSTGGNHYGVINEIVTQPTTPTTSTNVNNGGAASNVDQYQMETLTVSSVTAITVWAYGNSTKSNSSMSIDLYYSGTAQQFGSVTFQTGNSWQSASFTGLSLTQTQLNNLEILITGDAGGRTYTVSALYADVTYNSGVSISLNTDGSVAFGTQALDTTQDTTASGINDVETVSVDTGPADLDARSTAFSDGGNTWSLSTGNGADTVLWEFSPDGSAWTTFAVADTLYPLATNVSQGSTQDIYLRLTTPTTTSSYSQHSTTVTIVASVP